MTLTIDQQFDAPGDPERTAGVLRIVKERVENIQGLRVLDLACRTGAFSRAFAAAGAKVLGIEGKSYNFHQIPETPGATFVQDDVRNLNANDHGRFNVTLCLGILYHLGPQDALNLLEAMREVTADFAVIDTHIGGPESAVTVNGIRYQGYWFQEGGEGPWSSLGNDQSFWFTPDSLHTACLEAGWGRVETLPGIRWPGEPAGRYWLVIS